MNKTKKIRILFIFIGYLVLFDFKHSLAKNISKYDAQAIFLSNLTKYVNFNKNIEDYQFCLLEKTPLYSKLKEKFKTLIKYENDELLNCDILFIDKNYSQNISKIIYKINNKSVLTISDKYQFVEINNGIMEVNLNKNKVKLLININKIKNSSIDLDERILKISEFFN